MAKTIRSYIPSLAELPEQLHDAANKAIKALTDLEAAGDAHRVARHRSQQAPKADKQLLQDAVEDGKGDPGTPNTDKATTELATAERQAEMARLANNAAQAHYLEQMKAHRDAIAEHNQPGIHDALDAYQAAEAAHEAAAQHLRTTARWVPLLDQLDTYGTLDGHGGDTSNNPLHPDELRYITEATDAMTTPLPPEQVRMRRDTDGYTMSFPPHDTPDWAAKGWEYVNPDDAKWATVEPKHIQPIRR